MDCIEDDKEEPLHYEDDINLCWKKQCLHHLNKKTANTIATNIHFNLQKPKGLSVCITVIYFVQITVTSDINKEMGTNICKPFN